MIVDGGSSDRGKKVEDSFKVERLRLKEVEYGEVRCYCSSG